MGSFTANRYGRAWDEEKFLAKMKFISADGGHSMVVIGCECSAAEPEGRPVDPVALQREMARMTEFIGKVDRLNNVWLLHVTADVRPGFGRFKVWGRCQ